MDKLFNGSKIISLLMELDQCITQPCSIILCGGAAAIIGYGLRRHTGDIDIFEPTPKNREFYRSVEKLLKKKGLDPNAINDGAKGFTDYLHPDYRKRVIPLEAGFSNLDVSVISKADFITMKICAWRETDMQDVRSIGITRDDLAIINENLRYLARHSPDKAQKAQLVLSEIGVQISPELKPQNITTLAELIQFYSNYTGTEATLEQIREWKNEISSGVKPGFLAREIENNEWMM